MNDSDTDTPLKKELRATLSCAEALNDLNGAAIHRILRFLMSYFDNEREPF